MMRRCWIRRLLFVLLFSAVLLLSRRSCRTRPRISSVQPDSLQASLQHHERRYELYAANLTRRLTRLKTALRRSAVLIPPERQELREFLRGQLSRAQRRSGEPLPDEFAVLPFQTFTLHRLYQLETGFGRRPEETLLRPDRRDELDGALEAALHLLNQPEAGDSRSRRIYSPKHFQEGIFRTERDTGTLYDLAFRESGSPDFRRLVFFRPFGPLMKLKEELLDASQILINVIVPLTGTVDSLRRFVQRFSEECIRQDGRTHLTVVVFGSEKTEEVRGVLDGMWRRMSYRNVTLVRLGGVSSRGRALDAGARGWKHGNVLLLFCDVHVRFTAEFLDSCRLNTQPGQKVFYPVMFSLYNPELVPPAHDQMVIRKDFGFWKDDDFGMTCQYRSDFLNIGGFGAPVKGSDADDLRLYRKFLHSSLMVIRTPSRGLFHAFHQTLCGEGLSSEAFGACLQTKAVREASPARLGQMVFQEQIQHHLHTYSQQHPAQS